MNFRFTRWKFISIMGTIVIWYLILLLWSVSTCPLCEPNIINNCEEVFHIDILPGNYCNCGCIEETPISQVIIELIILLFPGFLAYIIHSLFQKNSDINKLI